MKKIFEITHEKIKPARMVDSVKHDVKKYLRRERNKKLPKDADFWDFDVKFGLTQDEAETIRLSEINKSIDTAVESGATAFYVEIIAKSGIRIIQEPEFDEDDYEPEFVDEQD